MAAAAGGAIACLVGCAAEGPTELVAAPKPPAAAPMPMSNPGAIVPATPTANPTPAAGGTAQPATPDPMFTKEATLAAAAACAGERFKDFQTKAAALKTAADAWAAAPADMAATDGIRVAWKAAMASWQEAELFRIGPAAAMFTGGPMIPGAKNIRNDVYAYPLRDTCTIDQHIANEGYKTFASIKFDSRGLGAIEYLAFNIGTATTCAGAAATAIMTSWTAAMPMLPNRRSAYTAAVAADIVTRANQLVMDWDAGAGAALAAGTMPYANQQGSLQALSDAMFYVDKELKDYKLGRPLKLTMDCTMMTAGVVCGADAIESRIAGVSTDNIRANLRGFRRVFEGCGAAGAGLGVDAWLIGSGFTDLATRMQTALNEAATAADNAPALETAITADAATVMNLHAKIKALTDLLKTEFLSMLELQPPPAMTPPPTPAAPPAGGMGAAGTGGRGAMPMAGRGGMPPVPGGFDGD